MADLDAARTPHKILVVCDCPLRNRYIRKAIQNRKTAGALGAQVDSRYLLWRRRGTGFESIAPLQLHHTLEIVTIASGETLLAARLLEHAHALADDYDELATALADGAYALRRMATSASGAEDILRPYGEARNYYHQLKRERYSFTPHSNKVRALLGEGAAGHIRNAIEADLDEADRFASELLGETPLGRHLRRVLEKANGNDDILVVLRHPEDAQLTRDSIANYLTEPGRFLGHVPEVRVVTVARFEEELAARMPTSVLWAAAATAGARAFVAEAKLPKNFQLVVSGFDAMMIRRELDLPEAMSAVAARSLWQTSASS